MMRLKPQSRRWRIILVRAERMYLGIVEAPDDVAAVKSAAKEFGYDERRLIAQPIE